MPRVFVQVPACVAWADVRSRHHPKVFALHTAELIRWAAIAALAAAVIRFPRPTVFWSLGAGRPFVLALTTVGPGRFRQSAGV